MKKNMKVSELLLLSVWMLWSMGMVLYGADMPPASNKMQPDHAPTPFSAEQIQKACPRNRKIVFQMETFGQTVMFQTLTFLSVEESKMVFEAVTTGTDGKQMGPRKMTTGVWSDLQAHASFPAAQTEIRTESITTPAGTFDCWLYVVTDKKNSNALVQRYWFAKKLPGPPVVYEEVQGERVVSKLIMLKTGLE